MKSIAVIDYGMGNLHSITKALQKVAPQQRVIQSADAGIIESCDRIVFPGVGAIGDCLFALREHHLDALLKDIAGRKPLLGICLGLQAMLERSDENGGVECLGIFPGQVRRFSDGCLDAAGVPMKIPHMGWSPVQHQGRHPLWQGIANDVRFYFVHSYYVDAENSIQIVGLTDYVQPFASALAKQNVFAVQFHPEKSQQAGLRLLSNFVDWQGNSN